LIRWEKEDGTIVLPASFIPLAEEKGLIQDITLEMIPRLTKDIANINSLVIDDNFYISFNLSENDLNSNAIVTHIESELSRNGVSASRLGVEISERVFMPLSEIVKDTIHQIANLGPKILLDDFSAGYSTLENLNQLPLTSLKLSMKIIRSAPASRNDFRLLRHLVSMGHQLRLSTIAEGIETREEFYLLTSTGCSATQGFYFSHPLPLNKFFEFFNKQPSWSEYPFGLDYLAQIDHIDFRRDIIREALTIYHNKDAGVRQRAFNRLPFLDHTSCLMGDWFNNVSWQWHQKADLEEVRSLHQEFHGIAKQLLDAASANKSKTQIDQLISELTENSIELMNGLQRISTIGITNFYEQK
jgi:EAL domain-containing protein (putative c-di-GMP-specific phosphodiesterase class I)